MTLLFDFLLIGIILPLNLIAGFTKKGTITKIIYISLVIGLIIIASSQTLNNDYFVYRSFYSRAEYMYDGFEIGYNLFSKFSLLVLHLQYTEFRCLCFVIMFPLVGFSLWNCSKRPNLLLLIYSIYFFSVNITQIRYGLAEAMVLTGVYFFLKRRYKIFIACIILASTFHIATIVFLALLLMSSEKIKDWYYNNRKKIIITVLILLVSFRVMQSAIPGIVNLINQMWNSVRISSQFVGYDGNHYLKYLPVPILSLILFHYIKTDENDYMAKVSEYILYATLFIYPFFLINRQLSRISRTIALICFITYVDNSFKSENRKSIFGVTLLVFFIYVYYCLSAYTSCLEPLINNSILSELFV